MKTQARTSFVEHFPVSPDVLWAAISDHEGMSEWGGSRVTLVAGPSSGGVGAVRRIHARGLSFDEEVVYADPPRRMVYRIVRGVPLLRFHRGEILIEPWGRTGAQLTWDIVLDLSVPGAAAPILGVIKSQLRAGLGRLRQKLAAKDAGLAGGVHA